VDLLKDLPFGEFVFRPSSKGPDNITLTWKFFDNNIVHLDIAEFDKPIGATIGSRLKIGSEEPFETLQEIAERYIAPTNKFVREASSHMKFIMCSTTEELETKLKEEKAQEPTRIPYKLTMLPEYPQHIVLGYIPKTILVKEYIKVKPKGYFFHDQCHRQI
jgi:transcription elongation factor SPT6